MINSTIFNRDGQRKYLTSQEIDNLILKSHDFPEDIKMLCLMLCYTGCRISEALSMTINSIDFPSRHVVIKCLKKRGKIVFRSIPLPPKFLATIGKWIKKERCGGELLWPWSRMTGYRRICAVMSAANIRGRHASPKGLRHGFGVRAVQAGVPLTLVQRWLGHADIKTTAIYTNAIGPEERRIASRMWRKSLAPDVKSQGCNLPTEGSSTADELIVKTHFDTNKVDVNHYSLISNSPILSGMISGFGFFPTNPIIS